MRIIELKRHVVLVFFFFAFVLFYFLLVYGAMEVYSIHFYMIKEN